MNVPPQGPPSEFTNYPRQGFGGGGTGRGPGVYFDYIGTAFEMVRKNPGVFVVGALVYMGVVMAIQIPFTFLTGGFAGGSDRGGANIVFGPMYIILTVLSSLISVAIQQGFMAGFAKAAIEQMDTGTTRFETIFGGFKNIGNTVLVSIMYTIMVYIGFILCIVPGVYVMGRLAFAPYLCAIEGISAVESLKKSTTWTQPYAWSMFGLVFVTALVSGLGVIACCVGVLWTLPLMGMVIGLHYRDFRDSNQATI